MPFAEIDPKLKHELTAFVRQLNELGWAEDRNLRINYRWAAGDVQRLQVIAMELVALQPDIIFTRDTPATAALLKQTHSIPVVFATVSDPVGSASLKAWRGRGITSPDLQM